MRVRCRGHQDCYLAGLPVRLEDTTDSTLQRQRKEGAGTLVRWHSLADQPFCYGDLGAGTR